MRLTAIIQQAFNLDATVQGLGVWEARVVGGGGSSGGGGDVSGPDSAVTGQIATALGTSGKVIQFDTLTLADLLKVSQLDTDATMAAASDTRVATQKATKDLVANSVAGLLKLQGNLDAGASPDYPAGVVGDTYYVTVAGTVGGSAGKLVEIGDAVICKATNAGGSEASVGSSWFVLQNNITGIQAFGLLMLRSSSASAAKALLSLSDVEDIKLSLWNGSTSLTQLGTVTAGVWNGTAIVPGYGGTGQTSLQASINALMAASGGLSQGDLFYFNGTNVVRLPAGTSGNYLKTQGAGANPVWDTISSPGALLAASNLSDLASKQTALNTIMAASGALTRGDLFYFNGTNVVRLPAGAAGYVLKTAGSSANPYWDAQGGASASFQTLSITGSQDADTGFDAVLTVMSSSGTVATINCSVNANHTYILGNQPDGNILTSGSTLDSSKLNGNAVPAAVLSSSATGGVGYATGAGGTVTQATSRSTGVTINLPCGKITMNSASLAAGSNVSFVVTNSRVAATDVVVVNVQTYSTGMPQAWVSKVSAGSFEVTVRNQHASTAMTDATALNFAVIKGVTS